MSLKNIFETMKRTGVTQKLDRWLMLNRGGEDINRNYAINPPSSALGCSRANYYRRIGKFAETPSPRLSRIFDNGHYFHDRMQKYFEKMGILKMREVPVFDEEYEIMGHTDGIIDLSSTESAILELKSINTDSFKALREPKEDHKAQGCVYLHCAEKHRRYLKETYKTKQAFKRSEKIRAKRYAKMYDFLVDEPWEGGKTKEEIAQKKVDEHLKFDSILYGLVNPLSTVVFLYEDKNTQEIKEFQVKMNEELLAEVLVKYAENNEYYRKGELPPRECTSKSRTCNFATECFS